MTDTHRPFHIRGEFRELLFLFFPILIVTFSNSVFLFVEKILLARLSTQAMEASVSAGYAIQIFQAPCVALAMMAQVCVGRWRGAKEWKTIGPGIWQFIWFSFLSMLITVPSSLLYGSYYFHGTDIEPIVLPYYYFLVSINFLYPLGSTLTCFYLGQGKTRLVLFATIASQFIKLVIAYILILGWDGWISSFGLIGGAMSTLIAQGGFCLFLFTVFFNSKHSDAFDSRSWHFQPKLFWESIHPGLLRASNRILSFLSWASIAHLMTSKGGDYILVISVGGTLFLFLPFIGDAICQAQTTVVSHILGARDYFLMDKAFRSGVLLVLTTVVLISVPFLIFPYATFHYLFPNTVLDATSISRIFLGVWTSFVFFTFSFIPISYVLAFKDTKFSLFMGGMSWVNGFLLMYVAVDVMQVAANQFWLILSLMHASTALCYYLRMRWLQSKALAANFVA